MIAGRFINGREGVGYFWNQVGYTRRLLLFPRVQWEFRLNTETPLTWADDTGFWQPPEWFNTDGGSVPSLARPFLPESQFPCSYSLHDAAWRAGGLFYSPTIDGEYAYKPLTRRESNRMLLAWLHAEGAGVVTRGIIYAGVTAGAVWR